MNRPTSTSTVAHVNGIELAYQVFGTGSPLVLLHGGFGSVEMFGPNLELLAAGHRVIGVDLQSHGRSPAVDRPMRFETMADDVVERVVLVSTVFKRSGWYPEMAAAMDAMGPETAEPLKHSPMYETYVRIAPRAEDWPVLVTQLTTALKIDYDWSADVAKLPMPVMIVVGDADGVPPSHAVDFFGLLGGGKRDANWDRSGMTHHRLAVLPGATHYDINVNPALSQAVIPFLGGAQSG